MIADRALALEVQKAIDCGAKTLPRIRRKVRRSALQIDAALTYLLLYAKTTRTETYGEQRWYLPRRCPRARFNDAPLSFSTLRGLMPRARSLHSR